uniref:Ribosomal protein L14 n=1 Tax=Paravannella minima TaxID=1443144 RepID=A0A411K7M0_9EUKA|nr:ribosomal protein L14 [Paravannella minima]QBC73431.1 ribosomal protein L14 [Paravannella minima]
MIYSGSFLKVIDNSGVRIVKCIRVYIKSDFKPGLVGSMILVSVRKVFSDKKIKKGEVYKGVIVRTKKILVRYGGVFLKCDSAAVVLYNKREQLLGNRILEPVSFELRNFNHLKIMSLAPYII